MFLSLSILQCLCRFHSSHDVRNPAPLYGTGEASLSVRSLTDMSFDFNGVIAPSFWTAFLDLGVSESDALICRFCGVWSRAVIGAATGSAVSSQES